MAQNEVRAEVVLVDELLGVMSTCGGLDPGPDPTWDPDEIPAEDEK